MKLAEFSRFCWRQWEDGGTVESMTLPAPGLREMASEVLAGASAVTVMNQGASRSVVAGARITSAVNPATR